ncbi:MAG: hypothetical protein PHH85_07245 [Candidatus Methanoperedens sp.]|nr:hypothetical protein [Candidatus Methanoperedens sp.]
MEKELINIIKTLNKHKTKYLLIGVDLMFIEQPRFNIIYEYHTKESSLREKDRLDAQMLRNIASLRKKG